MSGLRGSANVLVASAVAVLLIGVPAVAGSPFSALVGTWSGKGTARLEGGKSEQLSCKGYYSGSGGSELRLNIICANASTKVELRSVLKYAAAGSPAPGKSATTISPAPSPAAPTTPSCGSPSAAAA